MIKGTTNRAWWTAFVVLAVACGGRSENQSGPGVGGGGAAAGAPGVGTIDATGLPTQLPIDCPGVTSPPQLALPCKVGGSLSPGHDGPGSINVLECYDLVGETAAPNGSDRAVFSATIPFGDLPTMLNQPFQLPFALPPPPDGGLSLTGTVVFTQVDPAGRAFVARLIGGKIAGTDCTIPDTPFWAVAGDFT